ncbi:MAG: hypothetical protein AAGC68_02205, partial [Verrucomicrobiota bacterium]
MSEPSPSKPKGDGPEREPFSPRLILDRFLQTLIEIEASDLHLSPRNRPLFRLSGKLQEVDAFPDDLKEEEMGQIAELLAGESL